VEWDGRLWQRSIERFKAFMVPLGRSERRVAAANYVSGLLMPGQRKSIEPMAARLGIDPQRLQQFVTDSPWNEEQVWRVVRRDKRKQKKTEQNEEEFLLEALKKIHLRHIRFSNR